MKKTMLFIVTAVFGISSMVAQNNCSKYYPLEEGSSFQYTNYDKKGKTDGTVDYMISSVKNQGSATVATFDLKYTDKKGKGIFESNYDITCEDGTIRIDYKSLFPSQMMQQYTDMGVEMDISGTDIELPNDLSVGQELADANVAVAMNMSGIKMNITVDQTNRKVEKQESVTTTAGTFDCYLITETNTSKTMGATQEMNSKMWLAEGVGMVKQELYKKNGNLMSRTELTKFGK
ncbi:MAG: TapB family protein [Aurantibacter sp.]